MLKFVIIHLFTCTQSDASHLLLIDIKIKGRCYSPDDREHICLSPILPPGQ